MKKGECPLFFPELKQILLRLLKSWWTWTITILLSIIAWSFREGHTPWIFKKIWEFVTSCWNAVIPFLWTNLSIPRWWYWILNIVFVSIIVYVCARYVGQKFFTNYRRYTHDTFNGVIFIWKWAKRGAPGEGEPYKIAAYCPNCQMQLNSKRRRPTARTLADGNAGDMYYWCSDCNKEYDFVTIDEARQLIWQKKIKFHLG